MAQKSNIFGNLEVVTEWLCSTGYLFPRTETELNRFDKLFSDVQVINSTVSLERILNNAVRSFPIIDIFRMQSEQDVTDEFRMVARKGLEGLPDHILKKMAENHSKNNESSQEEED
ncbi:hypothetical protein [Parapedobacter soli]|uniref:hypothetical protein n=1 Tax=Parapedobacter soli TaxID=416955 RepID=UPI0021C891BC|nr:hypothetical protein [Parapedobacter soli]